MAISLYDVALLKRLPLFQSLPDDVIYDILRDAVFRTHHRHSLLFVQDDAVDRFFVVITGWVKLFRQTPGGEEAIIEVFGPGDSFGEAAMFMTGRYPVSAEIVEDARLIEIPAEPFRRRIHGDADLAFRMLGSMSSKLKGFVRRTEQFNSYNAPQRVAQFLLRYCGATRDGSAIRLPYDKFLIAGRLGMKPETFSRALAALRDVGVDVDRNEVRVGDIGELRRFAE